MRKIMKKNPYVFGIVVGVALTLLHLFIYQGGYYDSFPYDWWGILAKEIIALLMGRLVLFIAVPDLKRKAAEYLADDNDPKVLKLRKTMIYIMSAGVMIILGVSFLKRDILEMTFVIILELLIVSFSIYLILTRRLENNMELTVTNK